MSTHSSYGFFHPYAVLEQQSNMVRTMLLYTANISDYIKPAIPVMTKNVQVSDMINNASRDLLDFNNGKI